MISRNANYIACAISTRPICMFCCRNERTQSNIREVLCSITNINSMRSECPRQTVYKVNTLLFYYETGNMQCLGKPMCCQSSPSCQFILLVPIVSRDFCRNHNSPTRRADGCSWACSRFFSATWLEIDGYSGSRVETESSGVGTTTSRCCQT